MPRKLAFTSGVVLLAALIWILTRDGDRPPDASAPAQAAAETRSASSPARFEPAVGDSQAAAPSRAPASATRVEPERPPGSSAPAGSPAAGQADSRTDRHPEPVRPASTERTPTPADRPRPAQKQGSVDREAIRGAIQVALPEVRDCFEQAVARDPSLAGRVVVEFELETKDGQGTVTRGEVVGSETHSPFFEACVLEKVAGAKFPAPEGGGTVKVRYPFNFDPGGGFGGGETP